jgi:phenylpropionate dioxygenase-like ring-hydroxylating dioxygenase large terminal subunit
MARYSLPIPYGWYGVGFTDELKAGEVKPIHYFGKELVLFRTESGQAKVLDAFCPHLGAHLGHGGKVKGESIACPFHGWQFNGEGKCTAVPYAKNMPPKVAGEKQAIHDYPTVEKNQTIWVWYHPQRIEPMFDVVELTEFSSDEWEVEERLDWIINTTMQETGENAVDNAHFLFVHNAVEMPDSKSTMEGHRRQTLLEAKVPAMNEDGTMDDSGKLDKVNLTSIGNGPGQSYNRFTGALNAMLMGVTTPVNQDQIRLTFVFAKPKNLTMGQQMLAFGAKTELINQVQHDIPIWEHKIYLESPVLCDGDGPIHAYRKWFRQFYVETTPEPIRKVG